MARRRSTMPPAHTAGARDAVDRLIASWEATRPDLDFSPVGVIARLGRARARLDRELDALFAQHGVSAPTFAVLMTLARLQAPDGIPQRRLMDELGLTSGTVSVRVDRLVADGLVARDPDPADRRNARITLTPAGRELYERIAPAHLENERRLLAGLTPQEQLTLAELLRKLLVEFEGSAAPAELPMLGMALAPAHVTIAMRRAVGLPDVTGLLVRACDDEGAAAAAGIRVGDVVVRAGDAPVVSIADMRSAIASAAASGRLRLRLVRGPGEVAAALSLTGGSGADQPATETTPDLHLL